MVNFTILAGGFTSFIATYVFNTETGVLNLVKQNPTGDNVSWIAAHPTNSSVLYAVNEVGPIGSLQSFLIDSEGSLTPVDKASSGGNGPTFTNPLSTGEVTAANFGSPNASIIATDLADPARFVTENSTVIQFPVGEGPSNPHQTLEHNGEVFVPDLGADKIWRLARSNETGQFIVQGQIDIAPGSGPRHIAIRDNVLFTLNELTSTLTAQPIPEGPNGTTLPLIAEVSIIPPVEASFNGSFFAAEIVISEPSEKFPDPLIYVSNRNLGPDFEARGDTIAIFEFKKPSNGSTPVSTVTGVPASTSSADLTGPTMTTLIPAPALNRRMVKRHARRRPEAHRRQYGGYSYGGYDDIPIIESSSSPTAVSGTTVTLVAAPSPTDTVGDSTTGDASGGSLELVGHTFTTLQQIRSFTIGKVADGGDEFLVAGANTEGGVAVFQRSEGGRKLTLVAKNTELASRTSFVFL